jgi:hypothetical protein
MNSEQDLKGGIRLQLASRQTLSCRVIVQRTWGSATSSERKILQVKLTSIGHHLGSS